MKKLLSFCCLCFLATNIIAQNIEIISQTTFHSATWGAEYGALENVTQDNGGVLYVFVKNNSNQPDSVIDFRVSQNNNTASLDGWRVWPYEMAATGGNNVSTITAKSIVAPLAENNAVTIEVWTANGGYATQNYFVQTPKLRLANIIPSQDMQTLYVYVRNDDVNSFNLTKLSINENEYTVGSAQLSIVGGNAEIKSGKIAILKLRKGSAWNQCDPLAIRLSANRAVDNAEVNVGAGVRVVESEFFYGTWFSSGLNPDRLDSRIKNRRLRLNNWHGVGNYDFMDTAYTQFSIKNIREPNFGNPFDANVAVPIVQQQSNAPYIRYWSLDDEPDLSNKPIFEQMEKNRVYWENDLNTPSYVNLAVQKKYNRYGWLPDVVSMDHYAAPDAPNIIPLTWTPVIGRLGEMKEALEYTEYLKFNTEPRRMNSWCQFEANTWGSDPREQPRDYALNYQFWAHLAGGAKGIDFFVVQGKDETQIPEQYNKALKITTQASAIRGLISYNEYTDKVTVAATPANKVTARALVGEDAVVLIALNDNFTFTPSGIFFETAIDSVSYSIEFEMPEWLQMAYDAVDVLPYQLMPDGSKNYSDFYTEILDDNKIRITPNNAIYKESHVFVIGRADFVAPAAVTGLNIPKQDDDFNYVLSWSEPFDNFGTLGYILKYNGVTVDTVYHPVYTVTNGSNFNCNKGKWQVYAFDNSWNIGAPAELTVTTQNPVAGDIVDILSIYNNETFIEGSNATYTVEATNAIDYEWQLSSDGSNWFAVLFGANADSLNFYNMPLTYNNYYIRVIARSWCNSDTSNIAQIFVEPNSVKEAQNNFLVTIMPNPSNGIFNISAENVSGNFLNVVVTDVFGKTVKDQRILNAMGNSFNATINLKDQSNGIYFLQISNGTGQYSKRLVKY